MEKYLTNSHIIPVHKQKYLSRDVFFSVIPVIPVHMLICFFPAFVSMEMAQSSDQIRAAAAAAAD